MITVEGVDQLERLARNLRQAADKDLERELSKALGAVTRPIVSSIRQSARDTLPSRNGLPSGSPRARSARART
jgi:hypothetical protein